MYWIFFSFLSAFFQATTDAITTKLLRDNNNFYLVGWSRWAFAVPFLLPLLLVIPIPSLDTTFWITILLLLPLEITALLLYIKALQISPLSLTIPFLSFTPVFLLVTSFLMQGEKPDYSGLLGIFLVSIGGYLLNIHTVSKGILEPFRAITREKGCLLMLVVAFIYSITSNLGKTAIQHSSSAFFAIFYLTTLAVIVTPLVWFKNRRRLMPGSPHIQYFIAIGLSYALMFIFHTWAINMIQVPYMISLKRTSTLICIAYGHFLFGEKHIRERLLGSIIMLAGVVLIIVW